MTSQVVMIVSACTEPNNGHVHVLCSPIVSCTIYFRVSARLSRTPNNPSGVKKPIKYHTYVHREGSRTASATGTIPNTHRRRKLLKTNAPTLRRSSNLS